jgi:hypothetical protein
MMDTTLIVFPPCPLCPKLVMHFNSAFLFRDEVLPTLPDELNAHIDEDEYLAMKLRLLDTLELCMAKPVGEQGSP